MSAPVPKKYEEMVRVLDFRTRQRSMTVRGKKGIILTTIGETKFTLLEVLGSEGASFEVGERLDVSKESRSKIDSVLGKLEYERIPSGAKDAIPRIVREIVEDSEERFVMYINRAEPLTPRTHALEIIPGVGRKLLKTIIDERTRSPFESYDDVEERAGLKDPITRIVQRVMDEITGVTRMSIFVKR